MSKRALCSGGMTRSTRVKQWRRSQFLMTATPSIHGPRYACIYSRILCALVHQCSSLSLQCAESDVKTGFVFRGDDKVNTRQTMATFTVPDDCDAVDSRPEVRMYLFTGSVRFGSPVLIVVPTVRNRR